MPSGQKWYLPVQARISSILEFFKSSRKKTRLFINVVRITDSWSILSQIPEMRLPVGEDDLIPVPDSHSHHAHVVQKVSQPGILKIILELTKIEPTSGFGAIS